MVAEIQRWRPPLRCSHSGQSAGGEALDGDYGSQPILQSHWRVRGLRTQTLAEHPLGRSRHLRWARGYDSGLIERFRRGYRWFGSAVHGWWGEDPVFERR